MIKLLASFLAGIVIGVICSILGLVLGIYIFFFYSPKYKDSGGEGEEPLKEAASVAPAAAASVSRKKGDGEVNGERSKGKMMAEREVDNDLQLSLNGNLRISKEILSMNDVLEPHRTSSAFLQKQVEAGAQGNISSNWISSLGRAYGKTRIFSGFLLYRFLGSSESSAGTLVREASSNALQPEVLKYTDFYGVLQHKTLFLYSDIERKECLRVIMLPNYSVSLVPNNLPEHELYLAQNPIMLRLINDGDGSAALPKLIYLYPQTSSEKESWFLILRRASKLPPFADTGALSTFYQDRNPVKQYVDAMNKLVESTGSQEMSATAWLNALVGRMFVSIHANPNVREWVKQRLSRHTIEAEDESILGDIAVKELDVGNSLPVLSNPRLVSISVDGDMLIDMDIDYTGGVRLVLATEATLSVPAWDAYMKPITVPIVVAVKINRFSAKIMFKIKPFLESNRIWFGFYRQPELKLELEVEPIISNRLIKLQMVNKVLERRIKDSLEQYVMLPNMDDLSFWDFTDLNGSPFDEEEEEEEEEGEDDDDSFLVGEGDAVSETGTLKLAKRNSTQDAVLEVAFNGPSPKDPAIEASIAGEALESSFQDPSSSLAGNRLRLRRRKSIEKYIDEIESHRNNFDVAMDDLLSEGYHDIFHDTETSLASPRASTLSTTASPTTPISETEAVSNSYIEYLGNAAFSLGLLSRQYGLDTKAQNLANSVVDYTKPAIKFAKEKTESYKQVVQQQAAIVGLTAIEKLGLTPDKKISTSSASLYDPNSSFGPSVPLERQPSDSDLSVAPPPTTIPGKILRHKTSTTWSLLGLSISTSAPNSVTPPSSCATESISSTQSIRKKRSQPFKRSTFEEKVSIGASSSASFSEDSKSEEGIVGLRQASPSTDSDDIISLEDGSSEEESGASSDEGEYVRPLSSKSSSSRDEDESPSSPDVDNFKLFLDQDNTIQFKQYPSKTSSKLKANAKNATGHSTPKKYEEL